ncbi:FAD/NAD(P)-binding protein [Stappia sp. ES.058]|uniref:FAD/NAD(P)-binding protein n=1 Tax=Stappia sp. ES.058 TaxID=1881061 RepID=UPI000B838827|nr:FAD/NAD(P)-binding protein [Stappia sp. ES.058]
MKVSVNPSELRVGIVGFGPRGLIVLERMVAFARKHRQRSVKVFVYDRNEPGVGIHSPAQPGYLKLNTVAGQVTMFPGDIGAEDGVPWHGASLFDWCKRNGTCIAEDHAPGGTPPRPVEAADFLPRRILGDYLAWFTDEVLRRAPPSMNIAIHRTKIIGLRRPPGEKVTELVSEGGAAVSVDHTFITTGHGIDHAGDCIEPPDAVIPAYPVSRALQRVREKEEVQILGVGLSAMDLMAGVIDLWGGQFENRRDGTINYIASGNEGRLEFITRSGLPYRGRPMLRGDRHARPGLIFNEKALDALEQRYGAGRVDFDAHVEPLIHAEMFSAYRATREADPKVALAFAETWKRDARGDHLAIDGMAGTLSIRVRSCCYQRHRSTSLAVINSGSANSCALISVRAAEVFPEIRAKRPWKSGETFARRSVASSIAACLARRPIGDSSMKRHP